MSDNKDDVKRQRLIKGVSPPPAFVPLQVRLGRPNVSLDSDVAIVAPRALPKTVKSDTEMQQGQKMKEN